MKCQQKLRGQKFMVDSSENMKTLNKFIGYVDLIWDKIDKAQLFGFSA